MKIYLNEIFDEKAIRFNLDGKPKNMIFTELIGGIADLYPECDRNEIYTAIMEREEKMSTGIGYGIAIPHAFSKGIDKIAGAVGISKEGVDYGALDKKPVHIVFLLIANEHEREAHLHVFNQLFKLAQSEAIDLVKNAKNVQDVHGVLSRFLL